MIKKFICQSHRQWLRERPTEALEWWAESFELGKHYQELGMWEQSIRPLGSAFDTALICLEQQSCSASDASDRFSKSALCLTYSLLKLGELVCAARVVADVKAQFSNLQNQLFDLESMVELNRRLNLLLTAYPSKSMISIAEGFEGANGSVH